MTESQYMTALFLLAARYHGTVTMDLVTRTADFSVPEEYEAGLIEALEAFGDYIEVEAVTVH